jgi:hypothetical protein
MSVFKGKADIARARQHVRDPSLFVATTQKGGRCIWRVSAGAVADLYLYLEQELDA